jgi:hypothetical protein
MKVPAIGPFKAELRLTDGAPGGNPSVPSLKVEVGKPELALVRAQGAVRDPIGQKGIALTVSVEGREIGAFSGFSVPGMAQPVPPIPALGPFKANLKVTEGPAGRPSVPELKAELGTPQLIHVSVDGAVSDPLQQRGINIALAADSQDLTAMGAKTGIDMPLSGPMNFQARVSDLGPERFGLTGVKLTAGGSDVTGEATLAMAGGRPNVTANFASNLLDLSKLSAAEKADGKPAPSSTPPQKSDGRVFSNDPLPYDMLNMADGEFKYRAAKIVTTSVTVQNLSMNAALNGGQFTLRPLTADVGGGKLNTDVTMAAKGQSIVIKTDTKGVSLGSLLQESKTTSLIDGAKTDLVVDVRGAGPSMRAVMASLNGTIHMVSTDGVVHTKYLDLFGGDVLKVINPLTQGADTSKLNCIANRFEIVNGVGTTKVLVADTTRTTIVGEGTFNLGSEQLNMMVTPKSKDASLLSLTIPIRVGGTFASPSFLPDHEAAAKAVAGSVGGALMLGPAGILVPFMSQGQSGEVCPTAIATATGQKAPPASQQQQRSGQQPSQQQQQQNNPVQDLGRNLRGLFNK